MDPLHHPLPYQEPLHDPPPLLPLHGNPVSQIEYPDDLLLLPFSLHGTLHRNHRRLHC
uniref:Uncharacterized protein n=1 Tax=Lepeophtheirus salmonis TaxID=72036 RepID=A0A0K2TZS4_LEPSM